MIQCDKVKENRFGISRVTLDLVVDCASPFDNRGDVVLKYFIFS